jgi:hypothetical protein
MGRRERTRIRACGSLIFVAVAPFAAGCGGGASASSPTSTKPTTEATTATATSSTSQTRSTGVSRTQLIASADRICKRLDAELVAVKPRSASFPEIVRIVPGRAAAEQRAVAELSKLLPPVSLARDWRLIIHYRRTLASELVSLVRAAQHNDAVQIKRLSVSKERMRRSLLRTAEHAGFRDCGQLG